MESRSLPQESYCVLPTLSPWGQDGGYSFSLSKRMREEHNHVHSYCHPLHQHPYRKHPGARDRRENRKIGKNKVSLGHVSGCLLLRSPAHCKTRLKESQPNQKPAIIHCVWLPSEWENGVGSLTYEKKILGFHPIGEIRDHKKNPYA